MRALGIILTGGKNEKLRELTKTRALASMPVAGSYRAIDYALSNMVNSGISKVAVITQYNSRSLVEHLSSSKWWDFGRKHGGLFVFTPYITHDSSMWYRGTADAINQNIDFLKNSNEPYVIISSSNGICKVDFNDILIYHVEKKADITIICKSINNDDLCRFGHVKTDNENRIIDFEEKPIEPQGNLVSTGIYIVRRRSLIELIEEISKEGRYDLVNDIFIRYLRQKKIYAYIHDGYWRNIASLEAYFQVNMDFLKKDIRDIFFRMEATVMSKVEDEPPAKFNFGAKVRNSLSSSGCIINGQVEESVLFRKVFIGKDTIIKNSIILDEAFIGKNCVVENCIIDSGLKIPDNSVFDAKNKEIRIIANRF